MTRLRPIIGSLLALVVAAGLTACGETRGTANGTATTAPDYHNVEALDANVREELDKGETAPHNGLVKGVRCIVRGEGSAGCTVTYRRGPKVIYNVTFEQEGRSYFASPGGPVKPRGEANNEKGVRAR